MSEKMKKMLFVTDNFPFGNNQSMFILPELPALLERFEVVIASVNCTDEQTAPVPEGVRVLRINMNKTADKVTGRLRALASPVFYRECGRILRRKEKIASRLSWCHSYFSCGEAFAEQLAKQLDALRWQPDIIYCYWHMTPLFGVLMHRKRFGSPKIVARAHGRDLYDFRNPLGYQAFKRESDRMLDGMFLACTQGMDYYNEHFAASSRSKTELAFLGSDNDVTSPWSRKENTLRLVSCSNMVEVKRIDIIIDALSKIDNMNIEWTHMGGGWLEEQLKAYAQEKLGEKSNIRFGFTGRIPNAEVKKHLAENEYDFFITVTSTEGGVPVSVVEACSFGIPVIATNVGGVPDIVGSDNGFLLPENVTADEAAEVIRKAAALEPAAYEKMRSRAQEKWKNGFVAKENAARFADRLLEICGK